MCGPAATRAGFFGAITSYTPDGNFSICYQRTLVLAPAKVDVDYCGWLTREGKTWEPPHLPLLPGIASP